MTKTLAALAVLDLLRKTGPATAVQLAGWFDVTPEHARQLLRGLSAAREVEQLDGSAVPGGKTGRGYWRTTHKGAQRAASLCAACEFEGAHGTEELPHPVDPRAHVCLGRTQLADRNRKAELRAQHVSSPYRLEPVQVHEVDLGSTKFPPLPLHSLELLDPRTRAAREPKREQGLGIVTLHVGETYSPADLAGRAYEHGANRNSLVQLEYADRSQWVPMRRLEHALWENRKAGQRLRGVNVFPSAELAEDLSLLPKHDSEPGAPCSDSCARCKLALQVPRERGETLRDYVHRLEAEVDLQSVAERVPQVHPGLGLGPEVKPLYPREYAVHPPETGPHTLEPGATVPASGCEDRHCPTCKHKRGRGMSISTRPLQDLGKSGGRTGGGPKPSALYAINVAPGFDPVDVAACVRKAIREQISQGVCREVAYEIAPGVLERGLSLDLEQRLGELFREGRNLRAVLLEVPSPERVDVAGVLRMGEIIGKHVSERVLPPSDAERLQDAKELAAKVADLPVRVLMPGHAAGCECSACRPEVERRHPQSCGCSRCM